jgi:uncharacterized protein YjbI with pentapeptide repeats
MKCSILLLLLLTVTTFSDLVQAQDDTTWYWRRGDDPKTVKRTRAELDSLLELHNLWLSRFTSGRQLSLIAAYLQGARLEGYNLEAANLKEADLRGAHLEGSNLAGARLERARFWNSRLDSADLSNAHLEMAIMDYASLRYANLTGTYMENAIVKFAGFDSAVFEVVSLPRTEDMVSVVNSQTLVYDNNPAGLVKLREAFEKDGFKHQERLVICTLRRHDANYFEYIFFDLASEYGSNLSRPWYIFMGIWLLCSCFYFWAIQKESQSGVRIIIPISIDAIPKNLHAHVTRHGDDAVITTIHKENVYLQHNGYVKVPMGIRLIWWAVFFSTTSAFNIGFRDINFGRWLRLLTQAEFDIKPIGRVRMISGIQALTSVYLIGLWILSFAGTPFK